MVGKGDGPAKDKDHKKNEAKDKDHKKKVERKKAVKDKDHEKKKAVKDKDHEKKKAAKDKDHEKKAATDKDHEKKKAATDKDNEKKKAAKDKDHEKKKAAKDKDNEKKKAAKDKGHEKKVAKDKGHEKKVARDKGHEKKVARDKDHGKKKAERNTVNGVHHHADHPGHRLERKRFTKPYTCNGCKEQGIGSRYRCDGCDYDLHKHCKRYKTTTKHSFFPNCTFKFLLQPPRHSERYCDGCGKPVRGFVYHCKEKGWDLHPCCMNLPSELNSDVIKFRLHDKVSKNCLCCSRRTLQGGDPKIRGWSYVSDCGEYHLHVYCVSLMVFEAWKMESYNNNDDCDRWASANEKLQLTSQSPNRGRVDTFKIVIWVLRALASVFLGDPTHIIFGLIEVVGNMMDASR